MFWIIWLILIVITPMLAGAIIYWQIQSEQAAPLLDQSIELTAAPAIGTVQAGTSE
jgi:hypothetical protein